MTATSVKNNNNNDSFSWTKFQMKHKLMGISMCVKYSCVTNAHTHTLADSNNNIEMKFLNKTKKSLTVGWITFFLNVSVYMEWHGALLLLLLFLLYILDCCYSPFHRYSLRFDVCPHSIFWTYALKYINNICLYKEERSADTNTHTCPNHYTYC